jgi:hypothetical protein
MSELTDAEIVKALECCMSGCRYKCPFFGEGTPDCWEATMRNAIDIIIKQKAEIENNAKFTMHNAQRKYIDVDKFAEKICNFQQIDEDTANKMIFLLRTFPTADVEEVKHGEWVVKTDLKITLSRAYIRKEIIYICPHCNKEYRNKMNFCGNCGAKMDGGKAE